MNRRLKYLAMVVVAAGCQSPVLPLGDVPTVHVYPLKPQLHSVWPGRISGDRLVRHCGPGAADGVIVNVVLPGNQRSDSSYDNSVAPKDLSEDLLSGTRNLRVAFDCIESSKDGERTTLCDGLEEASADDAASAVRYREVSRRWEGREILFLMDVSGSTSGFVDRTNLREYPEPGGELGVRLSDLASDSNGFRWAQLKRTMLGLNSYNQLGVLAFREGLAGSGLAVPCAMPDASGADSLEGKPWREKLEACFGDRYHWLEGTEHLDAPKNWGRSNLWEALSEALQFLSEPRQGSYGGPQHLVVITDGPDTCGGGTNTHATPCVAPCEGAVSLDGLKYQLDLLKGGAPSIHFVHFDSLGYPGPSAAMMELACLTGGHYRFVNQTELPPDNPAAFQGALAEAMEATRLSLAGTWQVDVRMPVLSNGSAAYGTVHSLRGRVTLAAESGLNKEDSVTRFERGAPGSRDLRPHFRLACSGRCGEGPADPCRISCTDEGQCVGGKAGVPAPIGSTCEVTGSCCTDGEGATMCLAAGESCDGCFE